MFGVLGLIRPVYGYLCTLLVPSSRILISTASKMESGIRKLCNFEKETVAWLVLLDWGGGGAWEVKTNKHGR